MILSGSTLFLFRKARRHSRKELKSNKCSTSWTWNCLYGIFYSLLKSAHKFFDNCSLSLWADTVEKNCEKVLLVVATIAPIETACLPFPLWWTSKPTTIVCWNFWERKILSDFPKLTTLTFLSHSRMTYAGLEWINSKPRFPAQFCIHLNRNFRCHRLESTYSVFHYGPLPECGPN